MQTCKECNDTGVIETGNNDLPCDCPAGATALFNVAGVEGRVTGEEMRQHFFNNCPDPIGWPWRETRPASSLPGRKSQAVMSWAMWADLNDLIVEKIETQRKIMARFIDSHKHHFLEKDTCPYEATDRTITKMLQMPGSFSSYYYHEGSFYHWEGMIDTGFGLSPENSPFVVHLVEGRRLQILVRDKVFVRSVLGLE